MTSHYEHDLDTAEADPVRHDELEDDELEDDELEDDELEDDDPLNRDVNMREATASDPGDAAPIAAVAGEPLAMAPSVTAAGSSAAAALTTAGATGRSGAAGGANMPFSAERLSQEWREIQATFVDDPRGAVQLAAEAADSALTALMTSLRDHHATLGPSASQDTEQLREALQEYRSFCQGLAETGRRFAVG